MKLKNYLPTFKPNQLFHIDFRASRKDFYDNFKVLFHSTRSRLSRCRIFFHITRFVACCRLTAFVNHKRNNDERTNDDDDPLQQSFDFCLRHRVAFIFLKAQWRFYIFWIRKYIKKNHCDLHLVVRNESPCRLHDIVV